MTITTGYVKNSSPVEGGYLKDHYGLPRDLQNIKVQFHMNTDAVFLLQRVKKKAI